jgi:hypothetical protein
MTDDNIVNLADHHLFDLEKGKIAYEFGTISLMSCVHCRGDKFQVIFANANDFSDVSGVYALCVGCGTLNSTKVFYDA